MNSKTINFKNEYEFNAEDFIIGRLAEKISNILQGKNRPDYQSNKIPCVKVNVYNCENIKYTGKKYTQKEYIRHTQYPGHLKKRTLGQQLDKDSRIVLKKAVYNMLPKNKLRYQMMKNLLIYKRRPNN